MPDEHIDKTIYYEIIGISIIIFSFITLLMIGKIGRSMNIICRLILGDFYTIGIIIAIVIGIKLVFKLKINFFSLRMNGLYLLFISLSLLSHMDLYYYSLNYGKNSIAGLIGLYKLYISNFDPSYVFGAGFILGIVYQAFYFLLGKASWIIYLIVLLISIIFISNNSIKSFFIKIKEIKKIRFSFLTRYLKSLQVTKKLSVNLLTDFLEDERIMDIFLLDKLKNVFKLLGVEFNLKSYYISYTYILFEIDASYDLDMLKIKIRERINNNAIIYYKKYLNIEIPLEGRYLLTLKNLIYDEVLSIGYSTKREILDFDSFENILINGMVGSGIKTFIKSLIAQILLLTNYEIIIYDEYNEMDYMNLNVKKTNYKAFLSNIKDEIEQRFNNGLNRKLIVILNRCELKDIDYILQSAKSANVAIIMIKRNEYVDKRINSLIKTKIVFKSNSLISKELLNNKMATLLEKKGDFILKIEDSIIRCQSPYISDSDFNKLIRRI